MRAPQLSWGACDMDSRSDRTSGNRGKVAFRAVQQMQAKRSQSVGRSILRLESEKRTMVQTPCYPMQGRMSLSTLYMIGQDGRSPFPHQAMGQTVIFFGRLSSDTRKQQKLNLGRQWLMVSRISQMQAWAIPAVRKNTDPHCGPLICCLATRAADVRASLRAVWERRVVLHDQLPPGALGVKEKGGGGRGVGRNCKHRTGRD